MIRSSDMGLFSYTKILTQETPLTDRIAIPISILAAFTMAHVQSVTTIVIALVTIGTMIPRMFIAWSDWSKARAKRDSENQTASSVSKELPSDDNR